MKKYLIVNADDFNTDRERNRGILEAASQGIATSVTVLSNLTPDAASLKPLKELLGPAIGIHLNLTKGKPLVGGLKTLTDRGGRFFSKEEAWKRGLAGLYDTDEVEQEFSAQIEHLVNLGLTPDHLDGNNHVHILPRIAHVVARVAAKFHIMTARLPLEKIGVPPDTAVPFNPFAALIGSLSINARAPLQAAGIRTTDHFAGMTSPDMGNLGSVRHFLEGLPDGVTELMCHPGYRNKANLFSTVERECELAILKHRLVREDIERFEINLISFSDLSSITHPQCPLHICGAPHGKPSVGQQ
jgi:chitin disaccharide deacetylase